MDLFPNIDYKKTAVNVRSYLDTKLPRLLRMVNESPASLKSPVISDMPVNHDGGENHSEEKLIRYIAAKDIINGISLALNNCSQTAFMILEGKYIKELTDWQISQNMGYSKARYFQLKDEAFNEFADRLEMQKGCPDLHVYEKMIDLS